MTTVDVMKIVFCSCLLLVTRLLVICRHPVSALAFSPSIFLYSSFAHAALCLGCDLGFVWPRPDQQQRTQLIEESTTPKPGTTTTSSETTVIVAVVVVVVVMREQVQKFTITLGPQLKVVGALRDVRRKPTKRSEG